MHRKLDLAEEKEFRKWARDNYRPHQQINGIWHPVVQDECAKINAEADEELNKLLGDDQ